MPQGSFGSYPIQRVDFQEIRSLAARALGYGSRVRATVVCRASLNKSEAGRRLTIRAVPIQEHGPATQTAIERIGDNRQARRCFEKLVTAFRDAGIIESEGYQKKRRF